MNAVGKKTGLEALLTPEDSVLVLIDDQAFQFANVHSHETDDEPERQHRAREDREGL